jgi:hypothetical protein
MLSSNAEEDGEGKGVIRKGLVHSRLSEAAADFEYGSS